MRRVILCGGLLLALLVTGQTMAQAQTNNAPPNAGQKTFASPDDAIKAMQSAVQANDQNALLQIFGPEFYQLLTGDPAQDIANNQRLAASLALGCHPVRETENMITLEIGTNDWPMPIPLVKENGQWFFDTASGKEEIICRHIGKDELHAIGACRAYVAAQKQFAVVNGKNEYALQFNSSPGKQDGLYWPATGSQPPSPLGSTVAQAQAQNAANSSPARPYHGYYFRILTRQGKAAPGGKMDYLKNGELTGGFALVAWPEHWDRSGVMTFIVNQDGKVYQRNLGEKTRRIAVSMKEYNPDSQWKLVADEGIADSDK